ncbi:MAG TPA: hypothetical protein VKA97_07375, partial [Pyrinomonadaceae bacterium]|nr:hypothetical protein [Pyrinomonadaceae bacterium]
MMGAVLLCAGVVGACAQYNVRSRVTISITKPGEIKIETELSRPLNSWSFRNAYAGILGIAERVDAFRAQDAVVKKAATGEFRSDLKSSKISYSVKLSEPTAAAVSHVSWLVGDRGLFMLADLLPIEVESLTVEFVVPTGWTVESSITREADGLYEVTEPEKAVFFLGRSLSKTSTNVDGMALDIVLSGTLPVNEREALKPATRVLQKYRLLTGFPLSGKSMIMIAPLPVTDGSTKWKA